MVLKLNQYEVKVKATVKDESLKDSLVVTVNGEELALNEYGEGIFIPTEIGLYKILARVTDESGKVTSEEVEIFVYDPDDSKAPDVMIADPLDGAVVLAPTEIREV